MEFKLRKGSLYMNNGDETVLLGKNMECIPTIEPSVDEVAPISWDVHKRADFSFDMNYINRDMLSELCKATAFDLGLLEFNIPVMVQARWHKKKRINKKWLKRYGMKPDIVKVIMKTDSITMTPEDTCGQCSYVKNKCSDVYFEFESKGYECVLRPDQKRKELKIEW